MIMGNNNEARPPLLSPGKLKLLLLLLLLLLLSLSSSCQFFVRPIDIILKYIYSCLLLSSCKLSGFVCFIIIIINLMPVSASLLPLVFPSLLVIIMSWDPGVAGEKKIRKSFYHHYYYYYYLNLNFLGVMKVKMKIKLILKNFRDITIWTLFLGSFFFSNLLIL